MTGSADFFGCVITFLFCLSLALYREPPTSPPPFVVTLEPTHA